MAEYIKSRAFFQKNKDAEKESKTSHYCMLETYHTQQYGKHLTFGRQYGLRKSSFCK